MPILDLTCEAKASLIAGGSEPAHGGRLNVIRYAHLLILPFFFHPFLAYIPKQPLETSN